MRIAAVVSTAASATSLLILRASVVDAFSVPPANQQRRSSAVVLHARRPSPTSPLFASLAEDPRDSRRPRPPKSRPSGQGNEISQRRDDDESLTAESAGGGFGNFAAGLAMIWFGAALFFNNFGGGPSSLDVANDVVLGGGSEAAVVVQRKDAKVGIVGDRPAREDAVTAASPNAASPLTMKIKLDGERHGAAAVVAPAKPSDVKVESVAPKVRTDTADAAAAEAGAMKASAVKTEVIKDDAAETGVTKSDVPLLNKMLGDAKARDEETDEYGNAVVDSAAQRDVPLLKMFNAKAEDEEAKAGDAAVTSMPMTTDSPKEADADAAAKAAGVVLKNDAPFLKMFDARTKDDEAKAPAVMPLTTDSSVKVFSDAGSKYETTDEFGSPVDVVVAPVTTDSPKKASTNAAKSDTEKSDVSLLKMFGAGTKDEKIDETKPVDAVAGIPKPNAAKFENADKKLSVSGTKADAAASTFSLKATLTDNVARAPAADVPTGSSYQVYSERAGETAKIGSRAAKEKNKDAVATPLKIESERTTVRLQLGGAKIDAAKVDTSKPSPKTDTVKSSQKMDAAKGVDIVAPAPKLNVYSEHSSDRLKLGIIKEDIVKAAYVKTEPLKVYSEQKGDRLKVGKQVEVADVKVEAEAAKSRPLQIFSERN